MVRVSKCRPPQQQMPGIVAHGTGLHQLLANGDGPRALPMLQGLLPRLLRPLLLAEQRLAWVRLHIIRNARIKM